MGEPILRVPVLLQLDMLTQQLTDSLVPRDPPPGRDHGQSVESTRRKPDIGLLMIRHAPSIAMRTHQTDRPQTRTPGSPIPKWPQPVNVTCHLPGDSSLTDTPISRKWIKDGLGHWLALTDGP